MGFNIRSGLATLKWQLIRHAPIAALPWSSLRRIGQSRLMSLTIVVPFLGSLLLFNQHIVELLTLSPDVVRRWMNLPAGGADEIARQLTLSRLYFLYFGLTFLGFGSALFALFCPQVVKDYSSPVDRVQTESPFVIGSRIALIVSEVAAHYVSWLGGFGHEISEFARLLAQPHNFTNLCSVTFAEIFKGLPTEIANDEAAVTYAQESEDQSFVDHHGRPDPLVIAQTLISGVRRAQPFVQAFNKLAGTDLHRNDMLILHYMALDNGRPRLRVFVAFFYFLGFALLAIPTSDTFIRLALLAAR